MSFQPERSTTAWMQSARPLEPIFSQFAVSEFSFVTMFRRSSAGSMRSFSAILSSCTSCPKRGCGVPWPRLGPQAGLFVNTLQASNLKRGSS